MGDGMCIQTQKIAQQGVTAMARADRLQAGKQSPLLFIEQAIEKKNRCLELVGRHLEGGGVDGQRNGLRAATGQGLFTPLDGVHSGIEKLTIDFNPAEPLLLDQMAQRLLHSGVEFISQFMSVVAIGRAVDEGLRGASRVP